MKTITLQLRNSVNWLHIRLAFLLIALGCFALSPQAQATCQQGCLANGNTVLGDDALLSNGGANNTAVGFQALYSDTTGGANTANGFQALYSDTTGYFNTANGFVALYSNATGFRNTATGYFALFYNTTGFDNTATGSGTLFNNTTGYENTATGLDALLGNTTGIQNTATGVTALYSNYTGYDNTATGFQALFSNSTGFENTANGVSALYSNTTGFDNTATGSQALLSSTTGANNTATGYNALLNNRAGNSNTASGVSALSANINGDKNTAAGIDALMSNTTGSFNVALGAEAGGNLTTGSNNVDIANRGVAGESNTIRIGARQNQTNTFIAGISGVTVAGGVGVIIDTNGHLGTVVSSERFKDQIRPMDEASEAILALKPVTFRYKHELDPKGIPQFGLVAEDVEMVNPDLVARDDQGKPFTVRYEAVNAMLLNEFLKEHRRNEQQRKDFEAAIAQQKKQIEGLTAGLQKVKAELELNKSTPQTVLNNR